MALDQARPNRPQIADSHARGMRPPALPVHASSLSTAPREYRPPRAMRPRRAAPPLASFRATAAPAHGRPSGMRDDRYTCEYSGARLELASAHKTPQRAARITRLRAFRPAADAPRVRKPLETAANWPEIAISPVVHVRQRNKVKTSRDVVGKILPLSPSHPIVTSDCRPMVKPPASVGRVPAKEKFCRL
jgi:hypothetical protein